MNDTFSFEVLAELLASHYGQSAERTPVERVEQQLARSVDLTVEASMTNMLKQAPAGSTLHYRGSHA